MKKAAWVFSVLSLVLVIAGIIISTNSAETPNALSEEPTQEPSYEIAVAIKNQIEETPLPKGFNGILSDEDDRIFVNYANGEATVTIRAISNFAIPYVAEEMFPIAEKAVTDAGATLTRFSVSSYLSNKDGIVDGTFANWDTVDGVSGIFADSTNGETVVKPNYTIQQLYIYFADYQQLVDDIIAEAT